MPSLSAGGVSFTVILRDGFDMLMSTEVLAVDLMTLRRRRRLLPHELTATDMTGESTDDEYSPMKRLLLDINVCSQKTTSGFVAITLGLLAYVDTTITSTTKTHI